MGIEHLVQKEELHASLGTERLFLEANLEGRGLHIFLAHGKLLRDHHLSFACLYNYASIYDVYTHTQTFKNIHSYIYIYVYIFSINRIERG